MPSTHGYQYTLTCISALCTKYRHLLRIIKLYKRGIAQYETSRISAVAKIRDIHYQVYDLKGLLHSREDVLYIVIII